MLTETQQAILDVTMSRCRASFVTRSTAEPLNGLDDAEQRMRDFVRGALHCQFLEPDGLALRLTLWPHFCKLWAGPNG